MKEEDDVAVSRSITDDGVDWVSFNHTKIGNLCEREIEKIN